MRRHLILTVCLVIITTFLAAPPASAATPTLPVNIWIDLDVGVIDLNCEGHSYDGDTAPSAGVDPRPPPTVYATVMDPTTGKEKTISYTVCVHS